MAFLEEDNFGKELSIFKQSIIIKDVRLNIRLKLFLIKTPTIKIKKIDKDKKISGSIMFILFIIINLKLLLYHNYQLNYLQKYQMFPLMALGKNQRKL